MSSLTLDAKIEELARNQRRFAAEAYHFVFEALDHVADSPASRCRPSSRHITVRQLLHGLRDLAAEQFGPLARCVLESWGVYRTEDVGEIVFQLIDHDLLNRSDKDQFQDFEGGFSFREVFEEQYEPCIRLG